MNHSKLPSLSGEMSRQKQSTSLQSHYKRKTGMRTHLNWWKFPEKKKNPLNSRKQWHNTLNWNILKQEFGNVRKNKTKKHLRHSWNILLRLLEESTKEWFFNKDMTRETLGKEMMVSISLIVDLRLKGGAKGGNIHKCCYNKVEVTKMSVPSLQITETVCQFGCGYLLVGDFMCKVSWFNKAAKA